MATEEGDKKVLLARHKPFRPDKFAATIFTVLELAHFVVAAALIESAFVILASLRPALTFSMASAPLHAVLPEPELGGKFGDICWTTLCLILRLFIIFDIGRHSFIVVRSAADIYLASEALRRRAIGEWQP